VQTFFLRHSVYTHNKLNHFKLFVAQLQLHLSALSRKT